MSPLTMMVGGHFIVGAIDDDIWMSLTNRLVQVGFYTAQRERSVNATLQQVRYHEVDLVFSQSELEDGNIFQLAEAMNQFQTGASAPLILIGDNLSPLLQEKACEAGIDFAVERPFQRNNLEKTIQSALDSRRN